MSQQVQATVQAQQKMTTALSLKGSVLQRAAVNMAPINDVPAIVYEVLSGPGQPLDAEMQTFIALFLCRQFRRKIRTKIRSYRCESCSTIELLQAYFQAFCCHDDCHMPCK